MKFRGNFFYSYNGKCTITLTANRPNDSDGLHDCTTTAPDTGNIVQHADETRHDVYQPSDDSDNDGNERFIGSREYDKNFLRLTKLLAIVAVLLLFVVICKNIWFSVRQALGNVGAVSESDDDTVCQQSYLAIEWQ